MGLISWRSAAAAGAALGGTVAAGAGVRVAADRARARRRDRRGEDAAFGSLHAVPHDVLATDGVSLTVEVDDAGSPGAPTVVFVHGWLLDMDTWHYQRASLRGHARLVFYDQRSHGRSGRSDPARCTLDQLGADLRVVLEEVAPEGPVILVGHSMGGMTIMSLAAQSPDIVAERVTGVVLCATSAGDVLGRGSPVARLRPVLSRLSSLVDRGRRLNSYPLVRRLAVGPDAPEKYADMTDEVVSRAPTYLVWDFYPSISGLDYYTALEALPGKHTVVVGGTEDAITPIRHSRTMADLLEGSQLVVCEGAGHMVMLEEHDRVNRLILDLVEASTT